MCRCMDITFLIERINNELSIPIVANINSHEGDFSREIELRSPLTFIIGPNGSGKTHLLKG